MHEGIKLKENPEKLVGYCGLFCGACGIYQGRIRQAIENLRNVIKAYGLDKIASELAEWDPAFHHYTEFENVMDSFAKMFGECPACINGGGDPTCAVRICAKQKGYVTCAECVDMEKCEKVQRYGLTIMEGLKKIKAMGVAMWANEMQKKVNAGYCYLDDKP